MEQVKEGNLTKDDLDPNDAFLVSAGALGIWVWLGQKTTSTPTTPSSCPRVPSGSGSGWDRRRPRRREILRRTTSTPTTPSSCSRVPSGSGSGWERSSSERMGFHLKPHSPGLSRMESLKSSRAFLPAGGRSKQILFASSQIFICHCELLFWESNLNFGQGHNLMSSSYR